MVINPAAQDLLFMIPLFKKIKRNGYIFTVATMFNRVVPQWLFRARYYVVLRLNNNHSFKPRGHEHSVAVKMAESESEVQAVETLTYFKRAYSGGESTAFCANMNERLVGGFWAARCSFDENELGVQVQLDNDQCWLFAALVDKSTQGVGVYPRIQKFTSKTMVELGATDQLVAVNPFNHASYRVHKRFATDSFAGPVARIFAMRFLNWSVCFKRGAVAKKKTVSFNAKKSPIEFAF